MRKLQLLALAAVMLIPTLVLAAAQPSPGTYIETDYIIAAKAAGGGTCPLSAGSTQTEYFTYGGPGKKVYLRQSFNQPGFLAIFVGTSTGVVPAGGLSNWSQSGTYQLVPNAGSGKYRSVAKLTRVDADSFIATGTLYTYTDAGVLTCTNTLQSTYIRTGS
jgi:hypothetical protein